MGSNRLDLSGSGQGHVAGACYCGNEPSGSTKCREFLDELLASEGGVSWLNGSLINQSISQSVSQSVRRCQSASQPANQPASQSVSQSISQLISHFFARMMSTVTWITQKVNAKSTESQIKMPIATL